MSAAPQDWALMNAVRKDPAALGELFRRHKDFVYRVCWSLLRSPSAAEDATQDVFARLARQRRRLKDKAQFRTWLYRVATNTARDHLRRQQRATSSLSGQAPPPIAPDPSASAETDAHLADLEQALYRLSSRQREVVVLRVLEGFDTQETAEALNISEGSVKTHLHRGLATLRDQLT